MKRINIYSISGALFFFSLIWALDGFAGQMAHASRLFSMDMQMAEKDNTYVITLAIPRLNERHMDVTVGKNLISVETTYTRTQEKKDARGRVVRQDVSKTLSRGFSIPRDADYDHAVIDRKQDGFVITLPKLAGGSV